MEFQSYNAELAIANMLFKSIFSNIRIERSNNQGLKKTILVGCQFDQYSRIMKNLQNPERLGNIRLPMITISRTGYSRNGQRLNNLHNEVKFEFSSNNRLYELMTPIPIDINYEVSVIARYKQDLDKIASNFMVFFNSDIYVSCRHPKYEGLKLYNQIIMQDSVSEEHQPELDGTADDFAVNTFQFTFKTYLFSGTDTFKKTKRREVSVNLSNVLSTQIVEIPASEIDDFQKNHPNSRASALIDLDNDDEIDDFQQKYPNRKISAEISTMVQVEVSSVVETGDDIYDGVPIINNLDFGFYPTPTVSGHQQYMDYVDGYISGFHGNSVTYTTSSDISGNTHQISTDFYCSTDPYKDRLLWKINGATSELETVRRD